MSRDDIEVRAGIAEHIHDDIKAPIAAGRAELRDAVRPHETYEGRHRFDPSATWTPEEERKVVQKTDLRLLAWLCIMVCL